VLGRQACKNPGVGPARRAGRIEGSEAAVLEGTIRGIVAVSLVLVLSLATCGDAPRPATDAEPRPTMTEMVGVITEVHGSSGGVLWFQLSPLTSEDPTTWWIDPARDYGFDLSHLHEHLTTGDPVIVGGRMKAGRLVALSIEDA
jgi:hypothetical protein